MTPERSRCPACGALSFYSTRVLPGSWSAGRWMQPTGAQLLVCDNGCTGRVIASKLGVARLTTPKCYRDRSRPLGRLLVSR